MDDSTNAPPNEPEVLTQPLNDTLFQQISRTYHTVLPAFERHVGMSRSRWGVLVTLLREGEMSQALLQQRLRVNGAVITRQVKQLEDEGLVRRRVDPQDNRFTLVHLSEQGQQLIAGLVGRRESFERLITVGLSDDDVAVLRRSLAVIAANVAKIAEDE